VEERYVELTGIDLGDGLTECSLTLTVRTAMEILVRSFLLSEMHVLHDDHAQLVVWSLAKTICNTMNGRVLSRPVNSASAVA
jgi:hypothetical protein